MPERLRWTLTNEDDGSIYVLTRDPKGWDELAIKHNRSDIYDGMFSDFSEEMAFGCKGGGKEFIDAVYDTKGSEGDVSILVEYKCSPVGWCILFNGKLNMSSFNQQYKGKQLYTIVDVENKGITQVVKARDDVDVDLLATESIGGVALNTYSYAPYSFNYHSKVVHIESEWEFQDSFYCMRGADVFLRIGLQEIYFINKLNVIKDDFELTQALALDVNSKPTFQGFLGGVIPIVNTEDNKWLIQSNRVTITWNISGTLTFTGRVLTFTPDECEVLGTDNFTSDINGASSNLIDETSGNTFTSLGISTIVVYKIELGQQTDLVNAEYDRTTGIVTGLEPSTDYRAYGIDRCGSGVLDTLLIDQIEGQLRLFYGLDAVDTIAAGCDNSTTLGTNLYFIPLVDITPQFALTSNPFTKTFSGSGSRTVMMQPGYKIYSYWVIDMNIIQAGDVTFEFDFTNRELVIESDTQADATVGKAVMIHEAWSRVCEGITDQALAFKSEFFGRTNSQGMAYSSNGYGSFTAITDGLRIRGFEKVANPTQGLKETKQGIVTKLKDIYNACNSIWGIGLGIENINGTDVVRVEEKSYFYQDLSIVKLSNIPAIQMTFNKSLAYSDIEIGYDKWEVEQKGGLDEINTNAKWIFTKIKSFKNTFDAMCKYVAGMYAIEITRRQEFSVEEDTSYDNNLFVIATRRDVTRLDEAEKDENFTSVTNLISPETAYNLRFNLFSNFDRLMNQFTGNLTKDQPHPINYSYLEGNGNMTFQINENHAGDLNNNVVQNVQNTAYQNSLHRRPNPILLPEIYTFSYPLKFSEYLTILANPYGYIEFSEGTSNYKKGYIKTLNFNLKRKMGEFTLIRKFQ